ncbi:MAG: hypothetical protein ABSG80_12975 [Verrucomicrobiota bacterium]
MADMLSTFFHPGSVWHHPTRMAGDELCLLPPRPPSQPLGGIVRAFLHMAENCQNHRRFTSSQLQVVPGIKCIASQEQLLCLKRMARLIPFPKLHARLASNRSESVSKVVGENECNQGNTQ